MVIRPRPFGVWNYHCYQSDTCKQHPIKRLLLSGTDLSLTVDKQQPNGIRTGSAPEFAADEKNPQALHWRFPAYSTYSQRTVNVQSYGVRIELRASSAVWLALKFNDWMDLGKDWQIQLGCRAKQAFGKAETLSSSVHPVWLFQHPQTFNKQGA